MTPAPDDPAQPPDPSGPDPDTVPTTVLRRHAKPEPRTALSRLLVPVLIAAIALAALVAGWRTLQARSGDPLQPVPPAVVPTGPSPSTHPARTTPPATPGPPATAAPSASGDAGRPDPSRTGEPPRRPRWNRTVPVVVLNATSRTGLAASVAARLRAKGWQVTGVGNWRSGGVGRTTIFHRRDPRAVLTLVHDLPGSVPYRKLLPGMPSSGLVLVLAADFPG